MSPPTDPSPSLSPSKKGGRLGYIDTARGLFILLMASSHSFGLADVSTTSFFASRWWLPRGWSTAGFVLLSGFTVATVFCWSNDKANTERRIFRRAREIFAVTVLSNVAMLSLKYSVNNELHKITNLDWWKGLLTLQTEYSISGVLLPISIFLLLCPYLYGIYYKCKLAPFLSGVTVLTLSMWGIQYSFADNISTSSWVDVLFKSGAGGFPVLPLVSYGFVGFALGMLWKRADTNLTLRIAAANILVFIILEWLGTASQSATIRILHVTFGGVSRFMIMLTLAIAASSSPLLSRGLWFIPLIGKYSLFCFIAHRIIIQALFQIAKVFLPLVPEAIYLVCFCTGIGVLTLLCSMRERPLSFSIFWGYNRLLKTLYL